MSSYIMAYHGQPRQPASPEEGKVHMDKWKAWLGDLGDAVVNPGSPMGSAKLVDLSGVSDDDGPDTMTGFSIVKADSFDAALEIAKACPYLEIGGTLKVAELKQIQM